MRGSGDDLTFTAIAPMGLGRWPVGVLKLGHFHVDTTDKELVNLDQVS